MLSEEQAAAELAEYDRRTKRQSGYDMMEVRDKGAGKLRNLRGGEVEMRWHVDHAGEALEFEPRENIDVDKFVIKIDGKEAIMMIEDFRRLFRWV